MTGFRTPYRAVFSCLVFSILCLAFATPVSALIVYQGKVVDAWPEEDQGRALGKTGAAANGFYPSPKGVVLGLTMLVDFSDQAPAYDKAEVNDWLNLKGYARNGCNGSIRDYYLDVSNGKVDFQNEVFGFYRAKHPKSYYEGGNGYERSDELVDEMMAYFDPLVDFSRYDNDKNGTTEAISIVYAGDGITWAQGLWPHASALNRKYDGVTVGHYMMSDLRSKPSLYVFAHECGHMIFGWPDLYYFGDYCLMANRPNDYNPPAINDFYRADQGWLPYTDIDKNTNAAYQAWNGQAGFRYVNPAKPQEALFWSNVKNTGRWSNLKGKGLLLYHFDRSIGGNSSGTSRSLYVVEADGSNNLAGAQWPNPGSAVNDFFFQGNRAEISSTTSPSCKWNDGSASGLRIHAIGPAGDAIAFEVGYGVVGLSRLPRQSQHPLSGLGTDIFPATACCYDATGALRTGWAPFRFPASGVDSQNEQQPGLRPGR